MAESLCLALGSGWKAVWVVAQVWRCERMLVGELVLEMLLGLFSCGLTAFPPRLRARRRSNPHGYGDGTKQKDGRLCSLLPLCARARASTAHLLGFRADSHVQSPAVGARNDCMGTWVRLSSRRSQLKWNTRVILVRKTPPKSTSGSRGGRAVGGGGSVKGRDPPADSQRHFAPEGRCQWPLAGTADISTVKRCRCAATGVKHTTLHCLSSKHLKLS